MKVRPRDSSVEAETEDVVVVVAAAVAVVVDVAFVAVADVHAVVGGYRRLKTGSAFWVGVRRRGGATSRTSSGTS